MVELVEELFDLFCYHFFCIDMIMRPIIIISGHHLFQ